MEINTIVCPRGTQEFPWAMWDHSACCFTQRTDHSKCARIFAKPTDKWMPARAAVAIFVTEVGTRNDVQQTIRRRGVAGGAGRGRAGAGAVQGGGESLADVGLQRRH